MDNKLHYDLTGLNHIRFTKVPIKAFRPVKDLPFTFNKDPLGNAGWDLYATENVEVANGAVVKVPVNAHFAIPTGYYGRVTPRSGLSSEGINVIAGTIDSGYRGQISAIVQNVSGKDVIIERGLKLAQIIFMRHEFPEFIEVDSVEELGSTNRGADGFGSSGKY